MSLAKSNRPGNRIARCPGAPRRERVAHFRRRASFRAAADRAPHEDRRQRRQRPQLFRLGRRPAARVAARSECGQKHRHLFFEPRHFWARAKVPRCRREPAPADQRLAGALHDPGSARRAAESAVHAGAVAGRLDHDGALPGGPLPSRRADRAADRAGRGADHRHGAAARAARRYGRKRRDLWCARARSADRRGGPAGAGDGRGDRAGGIAPEQRPPDDHYPQSRHRDRRGAGWRLSDLVPAALCHRLPFASARFSTAITARLPTALQKPADAPPSVLRKAAKVPAEKVVPAPFRSGAPAPETPTTDELMAVRIARLLDNESFASAGAVSPLANVAYRLAKATHAPDLFIGTFSCGHVDVAAGTMTLTLLEAMDCEFGGRPLRRRRHLLDLLSARHRDARDHRRGADRRARAHQQSRADQAVGRQAQAAGAGRHVGRRQHAPELCGLRAAPWPGLAGRERRDGELGARPHFRRGAAGGGLPARRHLARHQPLRFPLRRGGGAARRGRDHAGRQPRDNLSPRRASRSSSPTTASRWMRRHRQSSKCCAKRSIRLASAGSNLLARKSAARCSTKSSPAIYKGRCRSFPL